MCQPTSCTGLPHRSEWVWDCLWATNKNSQDLCFIFGSPSVFAPWLTCDSVVKHCSLNPAARSIKRVMNLWSPVCSRRAGGGVVCIFLWRLRKNEENSFEERVPHAHDLSGRRSWRRRREMLQSLETLRGELFFLSQHGRGNMNQEVWGVGACYRFVGSATALLIAAVRCTCRLWYALGSSYAARTRRDIILSDIHFKEVPIVMHGTYLSMIAVCSCRCTQG